MSRTPGPGLVRVRGSLPSARAETMREPEKLRSTNWDHAMRVAGFSLADAGEEGTQTAGMTAKDQQMVDEGLKAVFDQLITAARPQ